MSAFPTPSRYRSPVSVAPDGIVAGATGERFGDGRTGFHRPSFVVETGVIRRWSRTKTDNASARARTTACANLIVNPIALLGSRDLCWRSCDDGAKLEGRPAAMKSVAVETLTCGASTRPKRQSGQPTTSHFDRKSAFLILRPLGMPQRPRASVFGQHSHHVHDRSFT